MYCKKCGVELRAGAKFCHKCGAPAPAKAPEVARPVEAVKPDEEVKTVMTREAPEKKVVTAPPAPTAEAPKLVVTMGETKASSSNGQFHDWFSEPGDL